MIIEFYLIQCKKLPPPEEQPYGLAWDNMAFVSVNDHPVPFKTEADARAYMAAWNMTGVKYKLFKVTEIK